MSEKEKETWEYQKRKLELQLWAMIEKEHEIMEQIVMIESIIRDEGNDGK